jgi:superfamily II DNA or RNA helicase
MPTPNTSLEINRKFLLEIGGWRTMKEAESLLEAGRVGEVILEDRLLQGLVRTGTTHVKARLQIGHRLSEVENFCSCRQAREYGTICPHVVALGLAWLQQHSPAANGQRAEGGATAAAPQAQPAFTYVPASEVGEGAPAVALQWIFPADLTGAWHRGVIPLTCEASLNGGAPRPLRQLAKEQGQPFALADGDLAPLDFMKRFHQGGMVDVWQLPAKTAGAFLNTLIEHPRVWQGREQRLEVARAAERSLLKVQLQENGELKLALSDAANGTGTVLQSKTGQWWLKPGRIEEINSLPVSYLGLRGRERVVPRTEIAHFFQHELTYLERQTRLVLDGACNNLEFVRVQPRIRATLDGTLSGLGCRATAVYHDGEYPIMAVPAANAAKEVEHWKPDAEHPLRYRIRDRASEDRARKAILDAGFVPGRKHPDTFTLSTEKRVGEFLANALPHWQRQWEVQYTTRMGQFMEMCDTIEPEICIHQDGTDWLAMEIDFREAAGQSRLTHAEVHELLNKKFSHRRMANGRIALLPSVAMEEFHELLRDCQVQQDGERIRLHRRYAGYLGEALKTNDWRIDGASTWSPPASLHPYQPLDLDTPLGRQLRPYQTEGVSWLHYLSENGLHGILADEMGLGKTVQTLCYLDHRRRAGKATGPVLVVCPTSLVGNWKDETERFLPGLPVLALQGPGRKALFGEIARHELVVTSYALLRRDLEVHQAAEYEAVVLDEAQYIKNRSSQSAQAVKGLRARQRLVLTGTPIENSLLDLWSIFDFLMPGYLGSAKDFKSRYELPIAKGGDAAAQRRLQQRVGPFVLRRTKAEVVKDLPAKLEQVAYCDLTEEQKGVYQTILRRGREMVFEHSGKGGQDLRRLAVLNTLLRLRQACNHLDMLPMADKKEWTEPSAKLDYFLDLLDQAVSGGHRVLAYSQFVSMLKLVAPALRSRGYKFSYLDGSTLDRKAPVREFQSDPSIPVFLISLKAGGTGLNLTGADTVVHFDPWWNPAVEDQATARAHRIGQTRIVQSYKLIARGTVEEKIVDLQNKKKDIAVSTLVSEESFVRHLTIEELQGLLE